ncbi:MAG TPA: ABC transporter permease [Candidatus Paceibacterota bacterium]|nr:ABC transporter permease [Candidatus Paceibacterota bacterium]
METFLKITKTTALMFVRNRQALFFTLFMPLIIMIIFGLIGFDKPQQYDIGVSVTAPQPQTQQFIDQLSAVGVFKIHQAALGDELAQLKDGNRTVVLSMPANFIDGAGTNTQKLTVYVNDSQQAQAQAVQSILTQYLDKTSLALAHAPTYFSVVPQHVDSRNLSYIDFLLPGLIAMSVMQMSVFSVAFLFVQYKEKGVLKRLLATPLKPFQFVAANAITRLTVSVAQTAIFIAVGLLMLKATIVGSYALVLLAVILGALMFLGLGFTISGMAKTMESVPVFANLLVFPMMFLGGVFFPLSSMPDWLQTVAKFLPLSFFSSALRDVMTKAAGLGDIKWDLVGMIVWGIVLITAATYSFSFSEREQ